MIQRRKSLDHKMFSISAVTLEYNFHTVRLSLKVCNGVPGFHSHSVYPLYFGLGKASRVESARTLWCEAGSTGFSHLRDTLLEIIELP